MEQRPIEKPRYQTGVHDPVLRQLITLLAYETKQGGPSGLLYAEHLAYALAIRLLFRSDDGNKAESRGEVGPTTSPPATGTGSHAQSHL